jgi:lipopolysaccharide/colanic/teichoic acid biosynthesis glycosyltransferase
MYVRAIRPARPNRSSSRLTLYIVDILFNFGAYVIGTHWKKLIMINVQIRTWLYASAMRGVRQPPLSRDVLEQGARDQMRRLGDVAIACILLAITLPLMIIVALAIKWESPGPVLDRQTCIGRGGRRFQMLKFRTAVHDPEHATPAWVAPKNIRLGRFIRHTRIEALPQLINVLRGEMSMIDIEAHSPSFFD